MNKLKRCGIIFLSCMTLSTATTTVFTANTIIAEAHSGRTDANGGHRDNKNKSGLGSYHYHCNGHPAHLHTNGVCPYAVGGQTDNSSAGNSSTAAAEAPSITYDLMNSYSRVFDPDYYYNTYPDLQTAIGTDKLALFTHFYNSGMAEGRKGCAEFDVNVYKENNTDLQTAFGSDLRKYYEHYTACAVLAAAGGGQLQRTAHRDGGRQLRRGDGQRGGGISNAVWADAEIGRAHV